MKCMKCTSSVLVLLALTSMALGASTETWTRDGLVVRVGTFENMIAAPGGGLLPGAASRPIPSPSVPVAWDAAIVDGRLVAALGDGGGLVLLDAQGGAPKPLALGGAGEVFAVVPGPRASVYAATGPEGAVFRVDLPSGDVEEVFRPEAGYIWDLLVLEDGDLAVATGLPGEVHVVEPRSKDSRVVWSSRDPHVRCLAARDGRILAGTAGSGWLVELDGAGDAFVLWDSQRGEIVDLAVDDGGTIWAAVSGQVGSAVSGGTGERPRKKEASEGNKTTITVKATADDAENEKAKDAPKKRKPSKAGALPAGGGALLRLARGAQGVEVWKDKRETPLALAWLEGRGLLMATATPARIWLFDAKGRDGWWDESPRSKAVTALASEDTTLLALASNPPAARLYTAEPAELARWTSDVLDTGSLTRFGRVHAVTTAEHAETVRVSVRCGNTSDPGAGWTDWVPVENAAGAPSSSGGAAELPLARFVQVRLEIRPKSSESAGVRGVSVRYRSLNRPPVVESIDVEPQGVAFRTLPSPALAAGDVPVVPIPAPEEVRRAINGKSDEPRSKKVYEPGALTLTWEAKDPDDDRLRYDVDVCEDLGEACERWTRLADGLESDFFSFDARALEDGVYRFRVTASDVDANPIGEGRRESLVSEAVAVDHRPPVVEDLSVEAEADGALVVRVRARDEGGRLAQAEVLGVDGRWRVIPAEDGVADGSEEVFRARVVPEAAREPLTIRVIDAAGNTTAQRER